MEKIYILGAPFKIAEKEIMINALKKRFDYDMEKAFSYGIDVLNRQINKAIGLLTFNSILFAVLSFSKQITLISNSFIQLLTLISCSFLLLLMFVVWFPAGQYESAESNFDHLMMTLFNRSYLLSISLFTGVISLICIILNTIYGMINSV